MSHAIDTQGVRLLQTADLPQLQLFLARRAASTMFMRSNLEKGAMVASPRARYDSAYVGGFDDGELTGVVAQAWNGMLMIELDRPILVAVERLLRATKLTVTGICGPFDQVEQLVEDLRLQDAPRTVGSAELLDELDCAGPRRSEPLNDSAPAQGAYEILGSRRADDFALICFADPVDPLAALRDPRERSFLAVFPADATNLEFRRDEDGWSVAVPGEAPFWRDATWTEPGKQLHALLCRALRDEAPAIESFPALLESEEDWAWYAGD